MRTPKQERNGVATTMSEGHNTAVPSADLTSEVAARMGAAEAEAGGRLGETPGEFFTPAGSGVTGHTVGAEGDMWAWDSGLAVGEQRGEA
jgi:hypothetical protein